MKFTIKSSIEKWFFFKFNFNNTIRRLITITLSDTKDIYSEFQSPMQCIM